MPVSTRSRGAIYASSSNTKAPKPKKEKICTVVCKTEKREPVEYNDNVRYKIGRTKPRRSKSTKKIAYDDDDVLYTIGKLKKRKSSGAKVALARRLVNIANLPPDQKRFAEELPHPKSNSIVKHVLKLPRRAIREIIKTRRTMPRK